MIVQPTRCGSFSPCVPISGFASHGPILRQEGLCVGSLVIVICEILWRNGTRPVALHFSPRGVLKSLKYEVYSACMEVSR